jgi:Cu/Ag efflux pump CusA
LAAVGPWAQGRREGAMAEKAVPFSKLGGIFALVLLAIPFSVSAAIGFIALFGISVMDGIIILSQFNALIDAGVERTAAILRTGELQTGATQTSVSDPGDDPPPCLANNRSI